MKKLISFCMAILLLLAILPGVALAEDRAGIYDERITLASSGCYVNEQQSYFPGNDPVWMVHIDDRSAIYDADENKYTISGELYIPPVTASVTTCRFGDDVLTVSENKVQFTIGVRADGFVGEAKECSGGFDIDWKNAAEEVVKSEHLNFAFRLNEFASVPRVPESRVRVELPAILVDNSDPTKNITYEYNNGTLTFTVGNISEERWQQAYNYGSVAIVARIDIDDPGDQYTLVKDIQGSLKYDDFLSNMRGSAGYKNVSTQGNGVEVIQFVRNRDGSIKAVPVISSNRHRYLGWKTTDADTNPYMEILHMQVKAAPGVSAKTFDDTFGKIPADRVVLDDLSASHTTAAYTESDGLIQYSFTGSKAQLDALLAAGTLTAETRIYAPEGDYTDFSWDGSEYYPLIYSDDHGKYFDDATSIIENGQLRTGTRQRQLFWKNDADGIKKEGFTFSFITGDLLWPDIYWERVPANENRLMAYDRKTQRDVELTEGTNTDLFGSGLTLTVQPGKIVASFPEGTQPDINRVGDIFVKVIGPTSTASHKFNTSGGSRGLSYDTNAADEQASIISNQESMPLAYYDDLRAGFKLKSFVVNGITIWYTNSLGAPDVVLLDWYGNNSSEPIKREYFSFDMIPFSQETTTPVVSKEADIGDVDSPKMAVADALPGTELVCTTYPQDGRSDAMYFELELGGVQGATAAVEGKDKVIYLPYSFVREGLTWQEAKGMTFTLNHYEDDKVTLKETLTATATEKGLRVVVGSLSPFVLEWETTPEHNSYSSGNSSSGSFYYLRDNTFSISNEVKKVEVDGAAMPFNQSGSDLTIQGITAGTHTVKVTLKNGDTITTIATVYYTFEAATELPKTGDKPLTVILMSLCVLALAACGAVLKKTI